MSELQYLDIFAGENRTLTLYARDPSNNVQDLTGKSVFWRVGKPPRWPDQKSAIIVKDGVVTDAVNGVFTVSITPSDTWQLAGNFVHVALTITDGEIIFITDTLADIEFVTDDGSAIEWVNDFDDNNHVVTSGILRIRAGIQGLQ